MIDAREVARRIKLDPADEAEVHRFGLEVVAATERPAYDGRPVAIQIPVEGDEARQSRTFRIACALQRKFQEKGWTVAIDAPQDAYGAVSAISMWFAIDPAALREPVATTAHPSAPAATTKLSLRTLHEELATLYGTSVSAAAETLPLRPTLSVIFGTYNRLPLLQQAIASVRSSARGVSYEIVVVDGGSTDGSRAWLAAQPDVLLVGEHRLEGAVRAFNQAFLLSRGEFIANLNDDAVVEGDALAAGVRHLQEHPGAGQVAFGFRGEGEAWHINDIYPQETYPAVTWGTTYANFGVTRRVVAEKVAAITGGYWAPVYSTYAADCELSAWCWKLGHTVDKRMDLRVHDVRNDDSLRARNAPLSATEAKRMYARWPAASFRPDGPPPRVTEAELRRYHEIVQGKSLAPARLEAIDPADKDALRAMVDLAGLPAPEEERRLRKTAPLIRALDPVEGQFPQRAESLGRERVLHIAINGRDAVDQQEGLHRALRELGSAGYECVRWTDHGHAERQRVILEAAQKIRPTVVFAQLQTPGAVGAETVRELRKIVPEAVIATWNGDIAAENSPHDVEWQVEIGRLVDLTMHSSMSHVRALRGAGVHNACYLQIGVDLLQYHPDEEKRNIDVTFLGNKYSAAGDSFASRYRWKNGSPAHDAVLRDEVVEKMREDLGDRFALYGSGWGREVRHVPVTESHLIYQRAKIGLSISLDNKLECYSSDRLLRVLACGSLALVKRFPGMSVLGLRHADNCLVFETAEEAVALARKALDPKNADLLRGIAERGARLATENHGWEVRMREMMAYVRVVRGAR